MLLSSSGTISCQSYKEYSLCTTRQKLHYDKKIQHIFKMGGGGGGGGQGVEVQCKE